MLSDEEIGEADAEVRHKIVDMIELYLSGDRSAIPATDGAIKKESIVDGMSISYVVL
jgi:hypothetical protein